MRPFLLLFLFLSFDFISPAQTFNYTHYTIEDGLASSNVYVAFQDSKHFMWLATENGVNRFDGKTFDTYTTEDGLSDNDVLRIFEDSKGRIWFLSIGGHLAYYKDGKIYNEKTDPYLSKGYTGAGLFYAFEDSKKRIWFCSYNAIVSVLDGTDIFKIKVEKSYPDFGVCVDEDSSGRICIFSKDNKYYYNEKEKDIIEAGTFPLNPLISYIRSSSGDCFYFSREGVFKISKGITNKCLSFDGKVDFPIISAIGDSKNNFYLASQDGAYLVETVAGRKKKIQHYLPNEWVNSMSYDNEGNLWFLTRRNGVYVLPKQYKENKLYNSSSLTNENIYSLARDNNGTIWIGSSRGQLAYLADERIHNVILPEKISLKGIFLSLEKDHLGNIWGCSDAYTYKIKINTENYNSKENITIVEPGDRSLNISFNSNNEPIIAAALYTSVLTEKNNKVISNPVKDESFYKRTFAVFYDNTDRLFISNIDGLHEKVNGKLISLAIKDPLLRSKIVYIKQAPDSTLLLATDGHGLIFYKNGKVVRHLNNKNGIPSDLCKKVKVYNNKIYVCTNKGLTQFTYKNDSVFDFVYFNKSNGLPSNDVRDVVITEEYIYVGTSKGLSVLNSSVKKYISTPPPIYIRSVINNSKFIDWQKPFGLEFNNNDLTVNFTAITFSNPEDVIYEYNFDNDTSHWKSVTTTTLNFPDISIGKYLFSIRARKKDGPWSKPETFSFNVEPPFYRTWWFESFAILSLFGGLSLMVIYINRRRMRIQFLILEKKNALNLERNRISADMHDDLGSDLSKIAVIAELIKIRDKSETDVHKDLHKISEFVTGARKKMDDIIWALNPSNDSVGSLIGYINQYCLNFFEDTGIKVDIKFNLLTEDVQLNARQRRNIFLVIKEIANNVLKHSTASEFYLHFSTNNKKIIIKVGDNGAGMIEGQRKMYSNGLNNILQRVNELYGTINLVTDQGSGLKYEISIPFNSTL